MREIEIIPEVCDELGFYHWACIYLHFIKEDGIYRREQQVGVEPDPDNEDI